MKAIIQVLLFILPWKIRRPLLQKIFHFEIAPTARIGFSVILAHKVVMRDHAHIGNLNFCKPIDSLYMGEYSNLGTRNFITGFSVADKIVQRRKHFAHIKDRQCVLKVGKHTGITSRHYFDCNGGIYIGDFCQIAGFETAFLTHSIDLKNNRQDADSIRVGDYSFIGTRCTFVKGAEVPAYSIVGACSLVNKKFTEERVMYAGVPCKYIKKLEDVKFFEREVGSVD